MLAFAKVRRSGARPAPPVSRSPASAGNAALSVRHGFVACACGGGCPRCQSEAPAQRKTENGEPGDFFEPPRQANHTGMPDAVRAKMERALAADFSDVRIQSSSTRALELKAAAFARGREIHVAPGHWAPETAEGQALLGHELAHVLQQGAGRVRATAHLNGASLNDEAALEQEADALGARAARTGDEHADAAARATAPLAEMQGGVVQRQQPVPPPVPGSPVDQVLQALAVISPIAGVGDFPAAFRILDGLAVNELLAVLEELDARSQLDLLIANSGSAVQFNQRKLVTAMQIARLTHGARVDFPAARAAVAASGLPDNDRVEMRRYLLPTARTADQRAGIGGGAAAAIPGSSLATEIGYELDPASRPAPAVAPVGGPAPPPAPRARWDGRTGAANQAAVRAAMQRELFDAFDEHLRHFRTSVVATLARSRVPFATPAAVPGATGPAPTGVIDVANQARAVLETRYATSMDAAAPSTVLSAGRAARTAVPGFQNIFDASSEADRGTLTGSTGPGALAPGVAWWLFENDNPQVRPRNNVEFATAVLDHHDYAAQDDPNGQFRWQVANAYAALPNKARELIDYRIARWSERGRGGITLQSAFDPGADRSRAELAQRWAVFKSATHESLHLRAHPTFVTAEQGRATMKEGFTEMFTVATLNTDVLPRVRAGSLETLRRTVEGALSPTPRDATFITDRTSPAEYVPHRQQAERIRDGGAPTGGTHHAGVGEAAVRAAFFQGHVEYIGLDPAGAPLAGLAAAAATPPMRIPGSITGLDDLARRSGVPRATIVHDNPGITDRLPAVAVLASCREHRAVAGETLTNIATQNGLSEAELVRANPDIALGPAGEWPTLTAGQQILIPVH